MYHKLIIVIVLLLIINTSIASGWDFRNPLYFDVFPGFEPAVLLSVTGIFYLISEPEKDDTAEYYHGNAFYLNSLFGLYPSYEDSSSVFESRIGFGYYFLSWFAIGLEVNISNLTDEQTNTFGVGWFTYFRWRFPVVQTIAVFFDYGFGMIFSGKEFPASGTDRNFTPLYGMGINIHISAVHYIFFGVRHYHISNGQDINNPGFNSNGFFFGYECLL